MGDGTNDSFSSGIMNQVNNTDGYTKTDGFKDMASNDIENAKHIWINLILTSPLLIGRGFNNLKNDDK